MGTFVGHIVPGLAFTFLGLWHIINTIRAFKLRGLISFTSRPWYPFTTSSFTIKHLELLTILSFSILAMAMQLLDHPLFHPSFKLIDLEHATMFLHLAIYASVALAVDLVQWPPDTFSGLVGVLACSVFGQELLLLHFHSADHVGLEGHYHWLLQLVVCVSLLSAVATTVCPSSFPAALVRSASILLQGCWFINMGFVLWVPSLVPKGCSVRFLEDDDMHGAVTCGTHEATQRAMALANLQFSWMLAGIMILAAFLCLTPDRRCADRSVSTEYEKLRDGRIRDVGLMVIDDADGLKQTSLTVL
ncbi:uncharacterized protein LOC131226986 [Magnolia sinica]|uniref:uncharacterized protein LOC131226986 n=1 Tax=Magnolia sinica TaxID=86752 RepID=UPI00265B57EF|nr:uncharacterized protein LOC131226986 [Magnolia sinica]